MHFYFLVTALVIQTRVKFAQAWTVRSVKEVVENFWVIINTIFISIGTLEVLVPAPQRCRLFSVSMLSPLASIHILVPASPCQLRLYNVAAWGSQVGKCPFLITQMCFHLTATPVGRRDTLPKLLVFSLPKFVTLPEVMLELNETPPHLFVISQEGLF